MSILLTFTFGTIFILLSRYLFKNWFNHLSLYTFIWMGMIVLYELKLIKYEDLRDETWVVIVGAFITFLLGILTIFSIRNTFDFSSKVIYQQKQILTILADDGLVIKYLILLFGIIGLFDAIYQWNILLSKFGGLFQIVFQADTIREMRLEGKIKGLIPFLFVVSYLGIFFAGIYTAYKNKISIVIFFPILAVIIKELANFSRAGILFGFFEFFIVFFLCRELLKSRGYKIKPKKISLVLGYSTILLLLVGSAILIKTFRNPIDEFQASSKTLAKYEGNIFISPSIYLYASSHIGVLNSYLATNNENAQIGENTFLPVYNFLSKFELVEHPRFFQKRYSIPVWTNTGSYLREIHADFGYIGLFTFPFILGLFTTYYWFKFNKLGSIISLIILTHLYLIISFSFFVMVTRLASWYLDFIILLILTPLIERFAGLLSNVKDLK